MVALRWPSQAQRNVETIRENRSSWIRCFIYSHSWWSNQAYRWLNGKGRAYAYLRVTFRDSFHNYIISINSSKVDETEAIQNHSHVLRLQEYLLEADYNLNNCGHGRQAMLGIDIARGVAAVMRMLKQILFESLPWWSRFARFASKDDPLLSTSGLI